MVFQYASGECRCLRRVGAAPSSDEQRVVWVIILHDLQNIIHLNVLKRKKKNLTILIRDVTFFLPNLVENISPGLDILRKPPVTRLAAGFHLFIAGICWAKIANYGFY